MQTELRSDSDWKNLKILVEIRSKVESEFRVGVSGEWGVQCRCAVF